MNYKDKEYNDVLEKLFYSSSKPSRYVGGELNSVDINKSYDTRMVMCFPDKYEVGMSNLGIKILYHLINEQEKMLCERCFAPDLDLSKLLNEYNIPLMSIETRKPLLEADILGFSVQFEMLYTNILYMLELAKIPFYAHDRDESYPLIIAGGPCMVNPEPIAPFFDAMLIGEGEDNIPQFVNLYRKCKQQGLSRKEFLEQASKIEGVYVPSLYPIQNMNGYEVIAQKEIVKKAVCSDFEQSYFPTKQVVSNMEIIHDRAVMELYRGCANGCRFCQAGFYYRPIRARSAARVMNLCEGLLNNTGYEEISLASLSTSDYKYANSLFPKLKEMALKKRINLSLPSLRLDSYDDAISENSRRSSLTFAPEAGTDRLRKVINKNITEDDIKRSIGKAFSQGYNNVKLYFMIGLPTETMQDIDGIADTVQMIRDLYFEHRNSKKPVNISVSTSVFIPKPLTPFQWAEQISIEEMAHRQYYLKDKLKQIRGVRYHYHESNSSFIESLLARGDRSLAKLIVKVHSLGSCFDSWTEGFNYDNWQNAINELGINTKIFTGEIDTAQTLPWDFIDFGVTKEYLLKELHKSKEAEPSQPCLKICAGCGANKLKRCDINVNNKI